MAGLRISKGLVAGSALEEVVASLIEEGKLSDAGDRYSARLQVSDAEIRLNGEVLPLPDEIENLLDSPVDFEALAQPDLGTGPDPAQDASPGGP